MQKTEASKTTQYQKWDKVNLPFTHVWECKNATNGVFSFRNLPRHQRNWLRAVKHNIAIYKMRDDGLPQPFDGWTIKQAPAYVVIFYGKNIYVIDIDVLLEEEANGGLKENRAKEIAHFLGVL